MEKKQDLRVTKTHHALCTTFLTLLEKKKFEEITVQELCDHAMIRRATFYKHFCDKYEFFEFFVREKQREFYQGRTPLDPEMGADRFVLETTISLIDYLEIQENRTIVIRMLESNLMSRMLDIFCNQLVRDVQEKIEQDTKRGIRPPASPEFCAVAYTGAVLQLLRWWYMKKQGLNKRELLDDIHRFFHFMIQP